MTSLDLTHFGGAIRTRAFQGTGLSSITIPDAVADISSNAFSGAGGCLESSTTRWVAGTSVEYCKIVAAYSLAPSRDPSTAPSAGPPTLSSSSMAPSIMPSIAPSTVPSAAPSAGPSTTPSTSTSTTSEGDVECECQRPQNEYTWKLVPLDSQNPSSASGVCRPGNDNSGTPDRTIFEYSSEQTCREECRAESLDRIGGLPHPARQHLLAVL